MSKSLRFCLPVCRNYSHPKMDGIFTCANECGVVAGSVCSSTFEFVLINLFYIDFVVIPIPI